ncbi:GGDEF domain-containing protein [Thioalkalivibrio sp. ALE12]|uniref:sensor domain-containing diguanylate cyclase n=1 Tax=Thioalkalivibrio sp. ALE12 TaxID=1158170 RepID=UPI000360CDF0|nr:GGDEF domain-containing protein [Thioalkalivibrio sp. ALE12]
MTDRQQPGFLEAIEQAGLLVEIWEHFPENMFLIRVEGPDFLVEAANPKMTELFGQDCSGKRLHDFLPWSVAEEVVAHYRECLRQDAPLRYEEHATFHDARGQEREGHWLTLLVPVHDPNGTITHLFGVSQNVTELRLARASLERYNRDLEAVVDERTRALNAVNQQLQEANRQLEALASSDTLTGVGNRRHFQAGAEREMERARRHGGALSLLMFDLDGFKSINDQDGHAAGDAVLRKVAASVQTTLRANDLFARYGGDEFVLLLPDTPLAAARQMGERLRTQVQEDAGVALSLGGAGFEAADTQLEMLVQRADAEVLAAKRARKAK